MVIGKVSFILCGVLECAHLKAVPKVNVQDLPTQPVQHQVGWVSEKQKRDQGRGKRTAVIHKSSM